MKKNSSHNLSKVSLLTLLFLGPLFSLISFIYYGIYDFKFLIILISTQVFLYFIFKLWKDYFENEIEGIAANFITVLFSIILSLGLTVGAANKVTIQYLQEKDVMYILEQSFIFVYLPVILITITILILGQKRLKLAIPFIVMSIVSFILMLNNLVVLKMDGSIIKREIISGREVYYELEAIKEIYVSYPERKINSYKYIIKLDDLELNLLGSSVGINKKFETRFGDLIYLNDIYKAQGIKKVIADKGVCYYDYDDCMELEELFKP